MKEKAWFAGRQAGKAGREENAEQSAAGGFCRQANKYTSINAKAETLKV